MVERAFPRKLPDEFIVDLKRLVLLLGSQRAVSTKLGTGHNSVGRWLRGELLPNFRSYIKVKQLIEEELGRVLEEG